MNCLLRPLIGAMIALVPAAASADFRIIYPRSVDQGELEIEHNGSSVFDRKAEKSGGQSYTIEFGTGLTSWWHAEIELGFNRAPGPSEPLLLEALVSENMFQITEPGEAFADLGVYVEYGQSLTRGKHAGPNQLTFGPVITKDIGPTTQTINLFFTRELGPGQTTQGLDFSYSWQGRWNVWAPLSPAIEVYGDTGVLGSVPRPSQQQLLVGPVAVGTILMSELGLGHAGKIKYELGWLFGTTSASPQGVLRWRLEVGIPF